MLTWIAITLTLTSLFLIVERLVRHRPNGIAIPPLVVAQALLLTDDIRRGDWAGIGLVALTVAVAAAWVYALYVARRRRRA